MVWSELCRRQTSYDNDGALLIFAPIWMIASLAFRNIPCIALFLFLCGFGSVFDQLLELLVVLSVFLSSQGSFSLFSSLVKCVFLLLHLFSFPCLEFQVVRACWVGVPPFSFFRSFSFSAA